MRIGRALLAGVTGGAVMSAVMAAGRALGIDAQLEATLGTFLVPRGPLAVALGVAMHLAICASIALLYALAFERIAGRADAIEGLGLSIPHAIVVGTALGALPLVHPAIGELGSPAPGPFMSALGPNGVGVFVLAHGAYGATVGTLYGRLASPTRPALSGPSVSVG